MATAYDYREVNLFSKHIEYIERTYDFSKDGGAVGVIDLIKFKKSVVVLGANLKGKTTCTSGGLATVEVGIKSGDTDALITATDFDDIVAGAAIPGAAASKDLVVADNGVLAMEIKVAALTAGKFVVGMYVVKF